jgi:hypothetical protein
MRFFDLLWGWADYTPKDWSGPPRSVVVRDKNGRTLAHVYFEDKLSRRLDAEALIKDVGTAPRSEGSPP